MRLGVVFTKEAPVRFVSHLDVQRLFQRAMRRARLPLAYSQGFNPHPLMSFATALSVGMTSEGEYLDVTLTEDMSPGEFTERLSPMLPEGVRIVEAFDLGDSRKSLTSAMRTAEYEVKAEFAEAPDEKTMREGIAELLSKDITVQKRTKGGIKPVDIRPMVIALSIDKIESCKALFTVKGVLSAEGGLNPETLLRVLFERLGLDPVLDITRKRIEMDREMLLSR